jgi:hypothetical protein
MIKQNETSNTIEQNVKQKRKKKTIPSGRKIII